MMKKLIIFTLFVYTTLADVAQFDPRFPDQVPEKCPEDPNFCQSYCLSIDAGTVRARCGRDLVSCICTNGVNKSIKVRFVQERQPVPSTTTTTTTTTPPPPPLLEEGEDDLPVFDYAPSGPVPQLLHCDMSWEANALCHDFCQTNVGASRGLCDVSDFSCLCEGVSPAVVKPAPIPAIFIPQPTTPPPPPPPPPTTQAPSSFWNPITPQHPNYYQPNPNTFFAPPSNALQYVYQQPLEQGQQPQQYFLPYPPQGYHNHAPLPNGYYQHQQGPEEMTPFTHSEGLPHNASDDHANLPISDVSTEISISESHPDGSETMVEANQGQLDGHALLRRRRRSPLSSGSSFFQSSGSSSSSSCSTSSCGELCEADGFLGPKCRPKCRNFACVCQCTPEGSGGQSEGEGVIGGSKFNDGGFVSESIKNVFSSGSDGEGVETITHTGGSSGDTSFLTVGTGHEEEGEGAFGSTFGRPGGMTPSFNSDNEGGEGSLGTFGSTLGSLGSTIGGGLGSLGSTLGLGGGMTGQGMFNSDMFANFNKKKHPSSMGLGGQDFLGLFTPPPAMA